MTEALKIKVSTVKFLMTMFESSCMSSTQVAAFKSNVEELVRRNQVTQEVRDLVYSLYGILNTNVYKESVNSMKLMQVNMMIMQFENNTNNLAEFKTYIENGVKNGSILKSAKDFIFELYELSGKKASHSNSAEVPKSLNKSAPAPKVNTPISNIGDPCMSGRGYSGIYSSRIC